MLLTLYCTILSFWKEGKGRKDETIFRVNDIADELSYDAFGLCKTDQFRDGTSYSRT